METLSANYLIKDSPAAVTVLDTDLCFVLHSNIWRQSFASNSDSILGKSFYEVLPNTPKYLKSIFADCLKGNSNFNKGQKFVTPNGAIQWLSWKINSWKNDDGEIGGLIVTLEDITEDKRREELLIKAEQVARIGGWEVDMSTSMVYWTEVTKEIHEVSENYQPTLEEGINFYKEGEHREKISLLVSEGMLSGKAWDTELIIRNSKG